MNRFTTLLVVLLAFAMVAANVTAAEADAASAGGMEEVDLDAEAPDLEEGDFGDDDGITLDFVINAIPAALLIDMSGNNFGVTDGAGARSEASSVYMMPSLSAGVGANVSDRIYVDALLGAGVLVNETLRSFFVQGTISATYHASESLSIGPRIGLIQFLNTEWLDDQELLDEVDFDDTTGLMIGLQLAMGDRVRYLVNIDYITMDFDVNAPEGVTADEDEYELEGLAVQFGVRGEF